MIAALAISVALVTSAATPTLRLARIDESFYRAPAVIVQRLLERTGYRVTVQDGSHTETYNAVASGEADIAIAYWLPDGHTEQWRRAAGSLTEIATVYDGARFYWAVPARMPAYVKSIADLARPEIAARLPKTIRALSLDTTITTASQKIVAAYGLAAQGFSVVPGDFASWENALRDATAHGQYVVIPL